MAVLTRRRKRATTPTPATDLPEAGDKLALEAIDHTGLAITSEGALVRIIKVIPPNPLIMSDQERANTAAAFCYLIGKLRPERSLQFYIHAKPVNLDELVATARREVAHWAGPPPSKDNNLQARDELAQSRWRLYGAMEDSLRRHADEQAAMELNAYVVVPYIPNQQSARALLSQIVPARGLKLPTAPLERDLRAHRRVVRESLAHTDSIRGDLDALGMHTRLLNGQEVVRLLWERFNPTMADAGRLPHASRTEIVGELDREIDTEEARAAALRLRELIAASSLDFSRSHFAEIDRDFEQTIYTSSTAEHTTMGWLQAAMLTRQPFTLSVYVHALDRGMVKASAKRKYRHTFAINRAAEQKSRVPDFERYAKEHEHHQLLTEMSSAQRANVYRVSIYQSIRARGPEPDVEALAEAVDYCAEQISVASDCRVNRGTHQQELLWEATLPLGRDVAAQDDRRRARMYVTRNVGDCIPLVGTSCGSPRGIPFAFSDPGRTLERLDPYDPTHANSTLLISGKSGSGKTNTANMLLSRAIAHGARGYVLDRAGHYRTLVDLVAGARHIDIGSDESPWALNPWDLPEGETKPTSEKVAFLLALHAVMMGDEGLTIQERSYLGRAIRKVYSTAAFLERSPRESMLREELLGWADKEADAGAREVAAVLRSLADRLGEFCGDGAYASVFDRETNVAADAALVVFDTARCSEIVLKPVMFTIIEYVRRQIEAHRDAHRTLNARPDAPMFAGKSILLIDEGWHLVGRRETGEYANDLARRARHLGLFLIVMSQQMSDFQSEYGVALLKNSTLKLILAQENEDEIAAMRQIFGLSDQEGQIISRLKTVKGVSGYAQALWINGTRGKGQVAIKVGPVEYVAFTSEPHRDVPARIASIEAHGGDVWAGIVALARDTTPLVQAS